MKLFQLYVTSEVATNDCFVDFHVWQISDDRTEKVCWMNYISQNESSLITESLWICFQCFRHLTRESCWQSMQVQENEWTLPVIVISINKVLPLFSTFAYITFVQTSDMREKELENDVSVGNQISSIRS